MPTKDFGLYYQDNKAITDRPSSSFYKASEIDATRWDQSFPYQLKLLVFLGPSASENLPLYKDTAWNFTLPIAPQDLTINMPIATTVQATLNGIVEQHGGAPFRDITFNGTTGVTPIKNNADPRDSNDFSDRTFGAIFAGTVSAVTQATRSASALTTGLGPQTSNINQGLGDGFNKIPTKSTGYYQFRLLQQFLEGYTEFKKQNSQITIDGQSFNTRDLRLAFAIHKDQAIYLVSGVQFQLKRSAQNPMEYMYSLSMRAWRKISSIQGRGNIDFVHNFVGRNPNAYASLIIRMDAAIDTLQATGDIFQSVINDPLNRLGEVTRETLLFLKTLSGVSASIRDLPDTIKFDLAPEIDKNWRQILEQHPEFISTAPSILTTGLGKILKGNQQALNNSITPASVITNEQLNDIFKKIQPDGLPLPAALIKTITSEKDRVKSLTRFDFEKHKNEVRKFSDDFADAVGAGSSTYNNIYNRSNTLSTRTTTDDEYNILFALNEVISTLDHLTASASVNEPEPTSLEYVAGLAEKSGIAFKVPISKFAVPFPYGFTLERLALQYLGDANRWHEIAILNGLRSPYIDEVGFSLSFLTNGDGNKLYVSDASNLYINQTVYISSNNQSRSKRHITNLREIYSGNIEVTLDGDATLDLFTVAASSVLEAFLPGTVNSQQVIYIPSDKTAPEDPETKIIPGVDRFDPFLQISGIDLLLNQVNDLVVTPDGDLRLAYGLQNVIQTVKLALATPKGSLLQHPEYGIAVEVGSSTADVSAEDILKSATDLFNNDAAFTGVKSASVVKDGPTVQITLIVGLTGFSDNVPITLNIKN